MVFDAFYFASYTLMISYYYTQEYKDRCDFFSHTMQIKFQKTYKKLLSSMPNGIILLDKADNQPVFYNRVVAKIIARRSGNNSNRSYALDDKKSSSSEEAKEVHIVIHNAYKE